jgi:HK97 family phage prohead protease
MPYYISDSAEGCSGWATIKEDGEVMGCHATKQDAIDQGLAIAQAEDSTFEGERAMPGTLKPGNFVSWKDHGETYQGRIREVVTSGTIDIPGSGVQIAGTFFDPAALVQMYEQVDGVWVEASTFLGLLFSQLSGISALVEDEMSEFDYEQDLLDDSPDEDDDNDDEDDLLGENRQVNLEAPAYMRAAARQGLKYYEEGLAGDGLVDRTVREARAMAEGNVTADKWVRLAAWIARHLVDLDAPAANPNNKDYPSAGVVAHLLWGSGPSKRAARRALEYAEGVVGRLEEENRQRVSVEAKDMAKIETRTNNARFEVRELDGGGMTFTGYAAVFNAPSEPLPFIERIAPGAFKRSLDSRNDVKLLWNHDTGIVLGSRRAGTLRLEEDNYGLRVSADLPDTQAGRDAAYLIKRGDVDSMSFGFSVPKGGDEWISDNERVLRSVRLIETSVVSFPAYSQTAGSTAVRALGKVAHRASVDADALADAIVAIESDSDLTEEQSDILMKVINELGPKSDEPTETVESEELDSAMLELKKKKLEQLLKGI